ncbi:MAG: hypothetical protein IJ598_06420 [Ruminococcus sp.]|nr:hypothetical protein [Ruminococcus sp.]
MEILDNSGCRRYTVTFSKTVNKSFILEEYQYGDMIVRLPLGALLFTVADAELQQIEINPPHILYDLYLNECDKNRIKRITEYLINIAEQTVPFDRVTLKSLFCRVLPRGHDFCYLFDSSERYRFRRFRSKLTLPFGHSTEYIFKKLSEQYVSFSFSAITEFHTLTELCALSLFEILESGQIVRRCACGRWFVANSLVKQCVNCQKQNTTARYRKYGKKQSVREYKNVYNRLQRRTRRKTQSLTDMQTFEAFKNEWDLLRIQYHNAPDYEERKIAFLQSERWK